MLGVRLTDPIGSLTAGEPTTVSPTLTLRGAAEMLAEEWIGLGVVADHRGVLGVVSERDIVRALAEGADADEERVIDVMSDDVAALDEEASILDAANVMAVNEIRHLAVRREGVIVGVLSIRDVVAVVLEELASSEAATPRR